MSIIVLGYNLWPLTVQCIRAVLETTTGAYEVIAVDNGSTDGTSQRLQEVFGDRIRVVRLEPNGFYAGGNNYGARFARGKYLAFVSNDTIPLNGWLEALLAAAERHDAAVVGGKMLFPDGRLYGTSHKLTYGVFPLEPRLRRHKEWDLYPEPEAEVDSVDGALFLIRRDVFEQVGGFDTQFRQGWEDVDLSLKVRAAGFRLIYTPFSRVIHLHSQTPGRYEWEAANRNLLQRRWMHLLPQLRTNPLPPVEEERPPVSLIMPTCNSIHVITRSVESALANMTVQDELITVDNNSTDGTREYLEQMAVMTQGRVRLLSQGSNLGFAGAVNIGLEAARHEYVCILHADTVIPQGNLSLLVDSLVKHPDAAAVGPVSNRPEGPQHLAAHWLPAFESKRATGLEELRLPGGEKTGQAVPTLLLSDMCLLARRSRVGRLDPLLPSGFAGIDLSLRLRHSKLLIKTDACVLHLGGSTDTLPEEVLQRRRQEGANLLYERLFQTFGRQVSGLEPIFEAAGAVPSSESVTVVMVTKNGSDRTERAIEAIFRHTRRPLELIVLDSGSSPEHAERLLSAADRFPSMRLLRFDEDEGAGYLWNTGLSFATGEHVLFLQDSVTVGPGWLSLLLAGASAGDAGLVVPHLRQITAEEDAVAIDWLHEHAGRHEEAGKLDPACLLVTARARAAIGGFDPQFVSARAAAADYAQRLERVGLKPVMVRSALMWQEPHEAEQPVPLDEALLTFKQTAAAMAGDDSDLILPLDHREQYSPDAPAVETGSTKRHRILLIPDWTDPATAWAEAFRECLEAFGAEEDVAIIVRVEPPSPPVTERVVEQLQSVVAATGRSEDALPELIVEATPATPLTHTCIYRAATVLLSTPGQHQMVHERNAEHAGIAVLRSRSASELRKAILGQ
ncbi:MAG: glycosyltransferase family 2 protein [Bacillota bacterium]